MSDRLQRVVVNGQLDEYRKAILGVPQRSVLGTLLFIQYNDKLFGLENMPVSYADDATVIAHISSPNMRSYVNFIRRHRAVPLTILWESQVLRSCSQTTEVSCSRTWKAARPYTVFYDPG